MKRPAAGSVSWMLGVLVCLMAPWALGADVAIPHTFLPGTRASAGEVNANFSAVETGIDDNARAIADLRAQIQALQAVASGGLVVKIAGTKVGYFVTGGPDDSAFGSYNELLAITDEWYFFGVSLGEAESGDPIVSPEGALSPRETCCTQPNCVGTRYLAFEYGDWTFMCKQLLPKIDWSSGRLTPPDDRRPLALRRTCPLPCRDETTRLRHARRARSPVGRTGG